MKQIPLIFCNVPFAGQYIYSFIYHIILFNKKEVQFLFAK